MELKPCPFCGGDGAYYDITPCFAVRMADALIANGVTFADVPDNNVGDKKPMTNFEAIKNKVIKHMEVISVEEMAKGFGYGCYSKNGCQYPDEDVDCYECKVKWLKQEADQDTD